MTPEFILSIGWVVVKILTIIGLSLYAIYAAIIYRQEQLMSKVLAETSEQILRIVALGHLLAAIGIVILAIILL